eukprot:s2046_g5.t1
MAMAPKKVMKAMMTKSKALVKGSLKTTASSFSKTALRKSKQTLMKGKETKKKGNNALVKGKASKLTKAQLDKLGQLSLKEKVEQATAGAETAEEAAQTLKETITPNERGQIWSRHQTALKGNQTAQEEHNALSKNQKGLASLLWFL